jgi:DNA replication and repair protein RecF
MSLCRLHLVDFRVFGDATFEPDPKGTTVITGPNGAGKTSVLEAIAYLGTQRSFRGAPREVMVRTGCDRAVVRADLTRLGLPVLVEAEVATTGKSRAQVNRQATQSRRDLAEAVPVTVFSPEDLAVVQGGPSRRRDLLDDALGLLDPTAASLLDQVDRVLRQRAALLRQSSGRLTPEVATTLEVWDERLATAGTALAAARESLAAAVGPFVAESYAALAGEDGRAPGGQNDTDIVGITYRTSWAGDLAAALVASRADDLRRGVTTVGPHRDDLQLEIAGRDARLQASQGEQRCLALALRLGVHRLVTDRSGIAPILLLDDVFSELDPDRSRALVHQLPAGQALLTTAAPLPEGISVVATVDVRDLGTRPSRTAGHEQ